MVTEFGIQSQGGGGGGGGGHSTLIRWVFTTGLLNLPLCSGMKNPNSIPVLEPRNYAKSCIVLYCIVLYCIVLYCIVLLCCVVLCCIVLCCVVLCCVVLCCVVLCCVVLCCAVLCCVVLCWWQRRYLCLITYLIKWFFYHFTLALPCMCERFINFPLLLSVKVMTYAVLFKINNILPLWVTFYVLR